MRSRFFFVAWLSLFLLAAGCATDKGVIKEGDKLHASLQNTIVQDPQLTPYIQRVGDRLLAAADAYRQQRIDKDGEGPTFMFPNNVQFHLVNDPDINAFTTGGHHVYILTGLFQVAENEDELAAVIAHELAHIYGRHVQRTLNRKYGISTVASAIGLAGSFYGVGDLSGTAANAAGSLVGLRYSRSDEDEADKLGIEFHARAGYDPARFETFFERMSKEAGDKGPEILSGHPSMKHRVEAAGHRAASLKNHSATRLAPIAPPDEFLRLQSRSRTIAVRAT